VKELPAAAVAAALLVLTLTAEPGLLLADCMSLQVTGVSPCIYSFSGSGEFVPSKPYGAVAKWLPKYAALGLDVVPLIDAVRAKNGSLFFFFFQVGFLHVCPEPVLANHSFQSFGNSNTQAVFSGGWGGGAGQSDQVVR